MSRRSGGARSDRSGRRFHRARLVYETRDAHVDEKQRNIPYTDVDGVGMDYAEDRQLSARVAGKSQSSYAARSDMFRNAVKMGIKISFGTDAAVFPHGQNAKEFKLMVDLGMQPIDALKSATGKRRRAFRHRAKGRDAGKRQTRRHHRHARRSDYRHHCDRARLVRDERRQNHPSGAAAHGARDRRIDEHRRISCSARRLKRALNLSRIAF